MDALPQEFANTRSGHIFTYVQIVFHQFTRWTKLQNINEEDRPNTFPRKYTRDSEIESEVRETRVLAILSASLFLEAFIYDYVARRRSGGFAEKLDKLEPPNKWLIATQLLCSPGISTDSKEYGQITTLFKYRNQLVHHKTKHGGSVFDAPELPQDFLPWDCLDTVGSVLKLLSTLDEREDVAPLLLRHFGAWFEVAKRDSDFYPIPCNA